MTREGPLFSLLARISPFILLLLTVYSCDFAPPDIVIISPQEGKSYYGTLPCDLRVSDNKSVDRVEVFLDGESVHLFTRSPYTADIEFSGYNGTTVEFKVIAQDKAGNFSEATRSVKLYQLPPPTAPTLSTPSNGSTITGNTPTFDWNEPTYAAGYELMVDNSSAFSSPEIHETNLSSSTYTPSSGLSNDTYYWKVRAKNSAGDWGNWVDPPWNFTITSTVATPTFSPSPGTYTGSVSVTISCATTGATIHYTTNGSTPTESSPTYTGPVGISVTTTLKAKAWKSGWAASSVASGDFTITGNIVVTEPTSSTVWNLGQQNVTISWDTGNLGGTVNIYLYKGTSQVATIATGTGNDGSHNTWDVPTSLTLGTDYRVQVYQDASHNDYSNYFTIASNNADLALTSLAVLPSTVTTRAFTACSFNIVNNGPTALSSEGILVDYYLSSNTTFGDGDDVRIGDTGFTVTISSGSTYPITLSSTGLANMVRDWPANLPGGNYYVFARVTISNPPPSDPTSSNNYDRTNSTIFYKPDDNYEPNDIRTSAYDLSSSEGTWLSSIDGYGIQADDDWYQISVTSGYERVLVDCRFTDSQGDIDIALYDASGNQLDASTSTTDDEYIDYTVDGGGTYYIKVYYGDAGNQYDLWWDDIRHDRVVLQSATPAEYGTMTFARSSTSCVIFDTVYPTPPHWKIICYNHYMDFTLSGKIDFKFHAAGSTSGGISYCYIDVYANGTKIANDYFVDKDWTWYSISSSNFTAGSNTVRIELQQYVPGTTNGTTHIWIDEAKTSGRRD